MSRNAQMLLGAVVVALACWAWRVSHAPVVVAPPAKQAVPWQDYTPAPVQPVQYEQPQPIGQQEPSASDIEFQANMRAQEQADAMRDVARSVDNLRRQQEEQALIHQK